MFKKILNPELNSNIFFWFVVLLPIFYLPLKFSTIPFSKITFVFAGVFLMTLLFAIKYIKKSEKKIISFNFFHISLIFILISYTISTLLSKNFAISFFGRDLALDSWITIFLLLSFSFIITTFLKKEKIANIFLGVIVSSGIISLLQVLHMLIPAFPSLGFFYGQESNLLGKVNDLVLFLTISLIMIVLVLEQLDITKRFKVILYSIFSLNSLLILLINFKLSLYILAVFGILFSLYKVLFLKKQTPKLNKKEMKVFSLSLIVAIVSIIWIFFGSGISRTASTALNFSYLEVRPGMGSTFEVSKKTLQEDLFFGSGPATFEVQWPLYKSKEVLTTDFWNLDFRYGFGFLATIATTTGIIGAIAWITFILTILFFAIKALLFPAKDLNTKFILNTSAFSVLALWTIFIFYIPSSVLFVMSFAFTGIFIFLMQDLKIIDSKKISSDKILKIIAIALIVLVSLVTLKTILKFTAHVNFQRASVIVSTSGDLEKAKSLVENSIKLDSIDTYYRSLAGIYAMLFQQTINNTKNPEDLEPGAVQEMINQTILNYDLAIKYDPYNYNNYVNTAGFYSELARLSIFPEESRETALSLYERSLELKIDNPLIILNKAKLEFSTGHEEAARDLAIEAIILRPNYLDAYIALSQISLALGDEDEAIQTMKEYIKISPQNTNARLHLALTYLELEMKEEAIEELEQLAEFYPNDMELKKMIDSIEAGDTPTGQNTNNQNASPETFEEESFEE